MEKIVNDPRLVPIQGSYNWRLAQAFDVQDDVLGPIEVPEGFVTDLGSIPKVFWNLIPPDGPATDAYVIHDWLYATQPCTRDQADGCLLRLLAALGVGMTRYVIYGAVRAFGWVPWKSDRSKSSVSASA